MAESNYLWEYKDLLLREGKEYLGRLYKEIRKKISTRARFWLGSGNKTSKYRRSLEENLCRL